MKYNGNSNYYTSKYIIFNFFISLFIQVISNEVKIGEYPYLKQLNSNRYILISSEGIAFLDPTLTNSSNIIHFSREKDYIYGRMALSTSVVQFPPEDGDLILATIYDELYIFDSNENLLNSTTIISGYVDYCEKPYYIIPYMRNCDTYIISYIEIIEVNEILPNDNNVYLHARDIIFNITSNIIYLSNITEFVIGQYEYVFEDEVRESIACCLLNYNNSTKINCLYGKRLYFEIFSLDPNNNYEYERRLINYTNTYLIRDFFKYLVLPGNKKVIYCTSHIYYLECIKYDAELNSYTIFSNFTFDGEIVEELDLNIKYFEDTDQIIFSILALKINEGEFILLICVCDLEGNCEKEEFNDINGIDLWDLFSRINIVIPFNILSYQLFSYYYLNSTQFLFDINIKFELKCKNYFNYYQTSCLKSIPEGYYCNDTNAKTIDICHPNCKTCNESSTDTDNIFNK